MKATILPATLRDVEELASFMRASDREECLFNAKATGRYNGQWSILGDLRQAFADGGVWSMWWGDELMGLGGHTMDEPVGAIWFLGTDVADRHPHGMTRASRRFVVAALGWHGGTLGNIVPKTMVQRVAWLQHLGFDMREGEAHSMLQGHVIFWKAAPSAPNATQRPL